MKVFRVEGTFRMGRFIQTFSKEVAGENESAAREIVYGDLGSKHRAPRRAIWISAVTEVPLSDVVDSLARIKAGAPE